MKKIKTIMLFSPLLQITARDGGTLKIIWSIKNHQMEAGFLILRFLSPNFFIKGRPVFEIFLSRGQRAPSLQSRLPPCFQDSPSERSPGM